MGSRRPKQLTFRPVLDLMGESLEDRFAKYKASTPKLDGEGNVLSVTTIGPDSPAWPEAPVEQSDPWWDQAAPGKESE